MKKKLKKRIEILKAENKSLEFAANNMEEKLKFYEIENETLKERIKQLEEKEREKQICDKCGYKAGCLIDGKYGKPCKAFITEEDSRKCSDSLIGKLKKLLFEDKGMDKRTVE